jgi:hypothetical protein
MADEQITRLAETTTVINDRDRLENAAKIVAAAFGQCWDRLPETPRSVFGGLHRAVFRHAARIVINGMNK